MKGSLYPRFKQDTDKKDNAYAEEECHVRPLIKRPLAIEGGGVPLARGRYGGGTLVLGYHINGKE